MSDGREGWKRLGRYVLRARTDAGYGDTQDWVHKTGLSARTLLGLERGEHVGRKTLAKVEHALDLDTGALDQVLDEAGDGVASTSAIEGTVDVVAAIKADERLSPQTKQHLLDQYAMLAQLSEWTRQTETHAPDYPDDFTDDEKVAATRKATYRAVRERETNKNR